MPALEQVGAAAQKQQIARDDDKDDPQRQPPDGEQADDARDHEDAVDRGIKQLAEAGDLVRAAGDLAVDPVRAGGDGEQKRRGKVESVEEQHEEDRHEAQADERDHVGNREDTVGHLFLVRCAFRRHRRHLLLAPTERMPYAKTGPQRTRSCINRSCVLYQFGQAASQDCKRFAQFSPFGNHRRAAMRATPRNPVTPWDARAPRRRRSRSDAPAGCRRCPSSGTPWGIRARMSRTARTGSG